MLVVLNAVGSTLLVAQWCIMLVVAGLGRVSRAFGLSGLAMDRPPSRVTLQVVLIEL